MVADKYRLDSLLAEGGMGSVWVATNLVLECQVAIKVLHSSMRNDLAEARLLREARAAAQIGHNNIVQVFDFGHISSGEPFIVMELLRGEDLAVRLSRVGRLSAIEAVKLMLPITSALAAGHAKGIVHRDMKPGNVFIALDDFGNEIPKVVDFGIAKVKTPAFVPKLTMEGRVVGSPEYLSPEQARGEDDLDATTDVWALCITLYETVTGDLPFHDENYNRLLRRIIEDPPRPIMDYAAGDSALWNILAGGLAKNRRERWPSMEELGRALQGWLERHGVQDIPRVRFASISDGDAYRASRPQAVVDGDAEPTLVHVPPPVPGPPPKARDHLAVPLPRILRANPSSISTPVPISVRSDPSPSRVEAPPVYGDTRTSSPSLGRKQLGPLHLIALVVGGLALGSAAVFLLVVMFQSFFPGTQELSSPAAQTPSPEIPVEPTHSPDPLPDRVPEPPPTESAAPSASSVELDASVPPPVPRTPRPARTRPSTPLIPRDPNF